MANYDENRYGAHIEKTNLQYLAHKDFMIRARDVINDGDFAMVFGPPGISKTTAANAVFRAWDKMQEKRMHELLSRVPKRFDAFGAPIYDLKKHLAPHEVRWVTRRLVIDPMDFAELPKHGDFRVKCRSSISHVASPMRHPWFHCKMYWACEPNEVLFIDDMGSLSETSIQTWLQMATNKAENGLVTYPYKPPLPDESAEKQYNFRGGVIIVANIRDIDDPKAKVTNSFRDAVRSRFTKPVNFSWANSELFPYITREAFIKGGLLKYLCKPVNAYQRDVAGLGFKGTEAEAAEIINEIRNYWESQEDRWSEISFRTLQQVLKDRVRNPHDWVRLAGSHLKPKATRRPRGVTI